MVLFCLLAAIPASCAGKPGLEPVVEETAVPGENRRFRDLSPQERAERMMKAFAEAYPGAIEKVEFRNGDWAVLMKGRWFYCADGRLLPEKLLDTKEEFARQSFYEYVPELPPWKEPETEVAERLKTILSRRRANPRKWAPDFFDTLWDAGNRSESYENLARVQFLGRRFQIHKGLAERLAKVERRIKEEAQTNPEVRQWIDGISSIGSWNWRNVAATASRSFHAYGTALDIQPKSLRGLQTYWQWTADNGIEWYNVPYTQRFHPPDPVVKAFEAYGFCWGGKWVLYDTMHFEYRPEILLMNGMTIED